MSLPCPQTYLTNVTLLFVIVNQSYHFVLLGVWIFLPQLLSAYPVCISGPNYPSFEVKSPNFCSVFSNCMQMQSWVFLGFGGYGLNKPIFAR